MLSCFHCRCFVLVGFLVFSFVVFVFSTIPGDVAVISLSTSLCLFFLLSFCRCAVSVFLAFCQSFGIPMQVFLDAYLIFLMPI